MYYLTAFLLMAFLLLVRILMSICKHLMPHYFYQENGLPAYQKYELAHGSIPMEEGPLFKFLDRISKIQKTEIEKREQDPNYHPKVRIAVCTARNAPAHKRVVTTLRKWDIRIDEAFFLGGMNKGNILEVYRPHIFFDDQTTHIESISKQFPSVT